jgi:WD40 repeat protein
MNSAAFMVQNLRVQSLASIRAILLAGLMIFSTTILPVVSAYDTDSDGIDDSTDDCPVAAGNSSVDRVGCPDRDGDGTSDKNDPWTIQGGGFSEEAHQTSNDDYFAVFFNYDGSQYLTSSENGWMRIWDTSTRQNLRSVQTDGIFDVGWSPDGAYVAAVTDNDELRVYHASNMSVLFTVSTDVGSGDQPNELEFSPNGTMIAVVIGRSGNSGTNGEVQIYNAMTGVEITSFNPGSADRFYSVDWSPDGNRILIGGREDVWIYNTGSWGFNSSVNTNRGTNNGVEWSPDGNSFATCEAWESSGARVRMYEVSTMQQMWSYSTSTSCNTLTFSPDSTQIGASMTYYQSDGASVRIFNADTGSIIDTVSGPRPGGCTSSGGSNNCGSIYGVDWHPNGMYIISAHGRDDEGIYHWIVDPDIDNDGVLNEDDAFPEDGTQWDDTDGDGYGDNPAPATEPDACVTIFGTSNMDRYGCPDDDGDGWSNDGDAFPSDPYQWSDADGDGYPSNLDDPRDPNPYGNLDAFDNNPTQWADSDGDGYGDNFANASWESIRPVDWPGQLMSMTPIEMVDIDTFPLNPEQWNDTDGDWVGDEQFTSRSDGCPEAWGDSIWDRIGCPDSDGDGYSDPGNGYPGEGVASPIGDADAFTGDPSQWHDSDGDGFGDNSSGSQGDACPGQPGTSWWAIEWDYVNETYFDKQWFGCEDNDGDGYANSGEAFPNDPTQWQDTDGDGVNRNSVASSCGDNPEGNNPDLFPLDGTQCTDRDGDGYGDFASGPNGDWFPDDPTQWKDSDGDGYGDNADGTNADVCPFVSGTINTAEARGCPDSDNDGTPDPQDAFPNNPLEDSDSDGDGFGDAFEDDCILTPGTSNMGGTYGCPDSDGDYWADSIDIFPNDGSQWEDTDGDGYGDNYTYTNVTGHSTSADGYIWGCDVDPGLIMSRIQNGDAFPEDATQWSDTDGDGHGDNYGEALNLTTRLECWPGEFVDNARDADAFPLRYTQWKDADRDGYGDNSIGGAFQGDLCKSEQGFSYLDKYGCLDSDGDGWSDVGDACPYDPNFHLVSEQCKITEPDSGQSGDTESSGMIMYIIGGLVAFLLMLIFVALVAKQMGARKRIDEIRELQAHDAVMIEEETQRRQKWIDYYLAQGDIEKAKELGYVEKAEWQVHQEKVEAEAAALPDMDDLFS